jgi:hypothetical protein
MLATPVRSLVVFLPLLALSGLAVLSPGPAVADGGDTSLIHACATATVRGNGAFLRIIGANESCPPGQTPVHWPGSVGDDPPPPSAAPRFVIRDSGGTEFGTFGGFSGLGTAFAHLLVGGRTFVLNVSRDRVNGLASSALYQSNDCTGTPYLQVFLVSPQPLLPLGSTFVKVGGGPPFDVIVQDDPTEAPVSRNFSSFQPTDSDCDPTDLPTTLTVTGTSVTLNPVPPFTITLE